MIYVISSRKAEALGFYKRITWAVISARIPDEPRIQADDQVYIDISSFSQAGLKKILSLLKKSGTSCFWGIIDPKGTAGDPASFFFKGASDYIGPGLVKTGLSKKRFTAASAWAREKINLGGTGGQSTGRAGEALHETETARNRKNQKLPAGKFPGWKTVQSGSTASFFFLLVSVSGKPNLRSVVGEDMLSAVKNRLREAMKQSLREAEALLWMETEDSSLFLIPPRYANGRAAIEAALKVILNSRIISMEKLKLSIPVGFTFAMHYGKTVFRAPGKTGTVISEPVNYIFHLGIKKAESGRLTVSDDVPDEAIPDGLLDLFTPCGVFEGIPIRHSRRFIYE